MSVIINPILRGFNPDPSILRVGEDYYIATSTFEWWPGVQIHHSRDLINWELMGHVLTEKRLLDMTGNPNSGGVWAPCLSYNGGVFYLVYTDVKSLAGNFKDTHNYVITAENILGPWSDPVFLNSSGFDPSLFHDEDGHKWLVNMIWDHRKNRNSFHGIVIQEFSESEGKLIGDPEIIFRGSHLGFTEGPHIYKRNGWYYLMTAEGGTGYEHAVTMARSRYLKGPYELDPITPILTSWETDRKLQKAGHASLVETQTGEWYLAHLCSRPIPGERRSPLGRETGLQRCYWSEDEWLRVLVSEVYKEVFGTSGPSDYVLGPLLPVQSRTVIPELDHFNSEFLNVQYASLREPLDPTWISLRDRPGFLRLRGRESLNSLHRQSLIARRQQSLRCEVETCVEFDPASFQQLAGLIVYYNSKNYFYLRISRDEILGKCLNILSSANGQYDEVLEQDIVIEGWKSVYMKAQIVGSGLQFHYSKDGLHWSPIGSVLDAGRLSDEACSRFQDGYFTDWGFTGTFLGICVQDLTGQSKHADFDYFAYREDES
ncbi:glycoside hydrolase family 43 protein [Paenibacillus sp. P46E]|uniref:glycoside hydrolase family 43 protein n=1 Tax=Paenibacillus sp. P46E TaxID=1349436 RepID=UPI00093C3504|nr:glycoside hydrolase family 43 protein [Paenibacillus sp. P46E]OKP97672.1 beta-xylosidase [Paenibacillus sp. P46E]